MLACMLSLLSPLERPVSNAWQETTEAFEIAHALGEPLNAIPYSQVFIARFYPSDDSPEMASLGAFATEDAAYRALANEALTFLLEVGGDEPWNATLPEDTILSEKENRDRALAWTLTQTPQAIISQWWDLDEDIYIEKVVVNDSPALGEPLLK